MAVNKLALMRYKTIDECLQNRFRKWSLDDLIEKVADALYEYEGISSGVSRRTIQGDLQIMRSDKLGYNAPIVVTDKKFYSYSEPEFSITRAPINNADIDKLKEIVGTLKQFNGFNYFEEMSDMIAKLENNIHKSTHVAENYIQFETNDLLKGKEHINPLYQAILNKRAILLEYRSFKAKENRQQVYYPYLLKEYRNRWFLICKAKRGMSLITLALDRIVEFQELQKEVFEPYTGVGFDTYYRDVIGVTKSEKDRASAVVLLFDKATTPYVITKPIHQSQQILKETEEGTIFRVDLVLNFELEKEILAFGEAVTVLSPRILRSRIKKRLLAASGKYGSEK